MRVKATDIGSREELKYDILCKADYIFAVDADKLDSSGSVVVKESFYGFPEIYDAIGSSNPLVLPSL